MRICFVTFEYPPFIIGGVSVYALNIVKELAKLGHEIHVITSNTEYNKLLNIENNVFVHRIPVIHKHFLSSPSFWVNLIRNYKEISKDVSGFDIVHSNGISDFTLSKRQVRGAGRVVTIHHLGRLADKNFHPIKKIVDFSGEGGLSPLIERTVVSRANRIIAVSNFTKESLVKTYRFDSSRINIIQHGVNIVDYTFPQYQIQQFRDDLGLNNNITFLFVGRLNSPRKNLGLLLKAFKIIKLDKGSVKLMLVGSGDKSNTEKMTRELGIEKDVIICGYVNNLFLRKCYTACDVVVSSSLLEGFGLVILEAMAAKKPVIAFNGGAIGELVKDGVNGCLVCEEDPQSFARAMSYLVENPDQIKKMGQINVNKVNNSFSWQKTGKLTELVYNSALNECSQI